MKAMNADVPNVTRAHAGRAGCSASVAKMIFTCNEEQVAVVAYVPSDVVEVLPASAWIQEVLDWFGGDAVELTPGQSSGIAVGQGQYFIKAMKQKATEILVRMQLMSAENAYDGEDVFFGDEDMPGLPEDKKMTILERRRTMRQTLS